MFTAFLREAVLGESIREVMRERLVEPTVKHVQPYLFALAGCLLLLMALQLACLVLIVFVVKR